MGPLAWLHALHLGVPAGTSGCEVRLHREPFSPGRGCQPRPEPRAQERGPHNYLGISILRRRKQGLL